MQNILPRITLLNQYAIQPIHIKLKHSSYISHESFFDQMRGQFVKNKDIPEGYIIEVNEGENFVGQYMLDSNENVIETTINARGYIANTNINTIEAFIGDNKNVQAIRDALNQLNKNYKDERQFETVIYYFNTLTQQPVRPKGGTEPADDDDAR